MAFIWFVCLFFQLKKGQVIERISSTLETESTGVNEEINWHFCKSPVAPKVS